MFSKSWSVLLVVYLFSNLSHGQREKKVFREDYTYLEATEGFYKIHTIPQTWAEAKQVCALEGASLFHPDNREEANAVISFWNSTQPKILEVYMGLSDITSEGQFETVDGKPVSEVYNQWKQGEPNDSNGKEDCVFLYLNGKLNDYLCDVKSNFICKKSLLTLEQNYNRNLINADGQRDKKFFREDYTYLEPTEGFYKIHTIRQNWTAAKQVCALEGASLFHPDNTDEANAVISFWKSTQPKILEVWIGLSDITSEGHFETVDGKSVSEVYNQWKQGEPTDTDSNEDCVYLYLSGKLNDYRCDVNSNFICKKSLLTLERNNNNNLINSDGQREKKFFREDYTYLESTEGFYKIHTIPQTWAEAKQVCAREGASLFHPDNTDEANAVISFWKSNQSNIVEVYVGLSDITSEGKFETVDGKSVSEVYNQWKQGEPTDTDSNEDCVYLYLSGKLNDYRCDVNSNFICKKSLLTLERNNNNNLINSDGQRDKKFFREDYTYLETTEGFYKIHTIPQTWAEAKQVCALEGASLFHPDNRDEANAVISFWKTIQSNIVEVYVGLSDITSEGQFKTVDGKSVSEVYNQWKQGEPNDFGGNEDCVQLYLNGNLNDLTCDEKLNFICKKSLLTLKQNYNCNLINSAEQRAKKFFRKDYSYIETSQGFYKMHTIPKTFADAKRECDLEGASLFYPDNGDEAQAVIAFWNRTQPTIPWVYAGLSAFITKGVFETIDNKPFSEVYQNWMSGEPNDALDKEDCVLLNKDGTYFDYRCDNKYQFICKKTLQSLEWNYCCNMPDLDYTFNKDNGKCYKFHTTPLKWTDAYAVCRAEQSDLAVISNRAVADYLAKLTESAPKQRVKGNYLRGIYHVGFHNRFNQGWQTVKGTPLNDTKAWWGNYIPEAEDREQCGSMFFNGLLTHITCDMRSFFICEHERDSTSQSEEKNYG